MKLCLIGNFQTSSGQICDERHIKKALEDLGHEVHAIQREEFPGIIGEHERLNIDATIFFKWPGFTANHLLMWKEITKAPVLAWTFDFMFIHQGFLPAMQAADLWLGEELGEKEVFERQGCNFHYFPNHAVPPDVFKKIDGEKIYDLTFTGSPYPNGGRLIQLHLLQDAGIDIHVWSTDCAGWKREGFNCHGSAFDTELSKVVGQSKIVLGTNYNNETCGYWSIRPIQVMMSGGFMLHQYVPGMEKELKDGIAYFTSREDCIEKVKYYLEHDEEREAIAKRGYEIAHQNLTSEVRARELIVLLQNYFKIGIV